MHFIKYFHSILLIGGPMVTEGETGSMEIVGIVSWGRGCAR